MKVLLLFFSALISSTALAYNDGTYDCQVDASTGATITIRSVSFSLMNNSVVSTEEAKLPFVIVAYYKDGVIHELKGLAHVDRRESKRRDKQTGKEVDLFEEVLFLGKDKVISFGEKGQLSENCERKF